MRVSLHTKFEVSNKFQTGGGGEGGVVGGGNFTPAQPQNGP